MTTLYSESFDKLLKFIFNFYDFDKDGKVSKEDLRVVLSYIPLKTKNFPNFKLKFENEDFNDRIESQDELHVLLEKCFKNVDFLDQAGFSYIVENVSSDIFLFILIFLLEKRPFSKTTLNEFEGRKKSSNLLQINKTPTTTNNRLVASPNLQSKFSPSLTISKSPLMKSRNTADMTNNPDSKNLLSKLVAAREQSDGKNILLKYAVGTQGKTGVEEDNTDENVNIKGIPVARKNRNNLKKLEVSNETNKEYTDLPIIPAVKQSKASNIEEGVNR